MTVHKVLLYYRFTPIPDPEAIRLWQWELCQRLGLTGRILISEHGINGTVGGSVEACKQYVKTTRQYEAFADIDWKWSEGTGNEFPKLSVKTRPEVVTFGVPDEIEVADDGVVGGGAHLSPEQVHELVESRDDVVFFDGRNAWEAEIGRFRGAVVPNTDTTADFIAELESGRYDELKDKPVVTYCTGGIRCEVLSALMVNRGFEQVFQIEGGIVRYGEAYGDDGLWEGSLAVFDGRERIEFSDHAEVIGSCEHCGAPTSDVLRCQAPQDQQAPQEPGICNARVLICEACSGPRAEGLSGPGVRCVRCR